MAKIEELTELLVNEISTFEKGIERLGKVGDKLNSTKISIDIKEYRSLMEDYHSKISVILNSQERIYERYEKLLKKARIYPNWAVIVFIISLLFGIVSTTFIIISKQETKLIDKEAYQKGAIDSNNNIQVFLEKHPKSKKTFEKRKKKIE